MAPTNTARFIKMRFISFCVRLCMRMADKGKHITMLVLCFVSLSTVYVFYHVTNHGYFYLSWDSQELGLPTRSSWVKGRLPMAEDPDGPVFAAEHVQRRLLAMDGCVTATDNQAALGDIVYVARYGLHPEDHAPLCGQPAPPLQQKGLSTTPEPRALRGQMTSYCGTPKLACTFWLSVFRFLCNDTNGMQFQSPLDMSIMDIHYNDFNMRFYSRSHLGLLADDFRFMFVREPYSRLWSAYVDKFYLPDFWGRANKVILHSLKRKARQRGNPCGNDVTFEEFLHYLADADPNGMNNHWKPVQLQCSPCLFRPHVIGKLETFASDSRLVLQQLNASWILESFDHQRHLHNEVQQLTDFNYEIIQRDHIKNCTNETDVARRLWTAFQCNGYIPAETPFPFQNVNASDGPNSTRLKEEVLRAMHDGKTRSKAEWRQQREDAMREAYGTVPTDVLVAIRDLYWMDFILYDYDPEPRALFANRTFISRVRR